MLPIADQNLPGRGPAVVTLTLIVINVLVFFFVQLPNDAFTYSWATVPREIATGQDIVGIVRVPGGSFFLGPSPSPIYLTLISSMFMHGSFVHLGGNMLFLYIFGDNVEHALGPLTFLVFYLGAGIVGALAQVLVDPSSLIPSLGASGAISGVLAAYLVFFPSNRVLVFAFYMTFLAPAVLVIGLWALLQFVNGVGQIAVSEQTGGIAYMAHIGGFLTGLLVGFLGRSWAAARLRGS